MPHAATNLSQLRQLQGCAGVPLLSAHAHCLFYYFTYSTEYAHTYVHSMQHAALGCL
jgi:hypothetical protein